MTMTAAQKSQVSRAFTLVARQFELPNVDAQRMGMAFMAAIDALKPGQSVDLQPLFDYLVKEQRISHIDVLDFCIVLQSRQDKIGVSFSMPAQAREITPERVERVLNQFNRKTNPSAYERKGPEEPAAAPAAGAQWEPSKKKKDNTRSRLLQVLGVTAVAGVVVLGLQMKGAEADLQEIPLAQVQGGLGCTRVRANREVAICDLPARLWSPAKESTIREQAQRLRQGLSNRGVTRVFVRLSADGTPDHGKVVVSLL